MVRIPRCGRGDLGSNPSSHTIGLKFFILVSYNRPSLVPQGHNPFLILTISVWPIDPSLQGQISFTLLVFHYIYIYIVLYWQRSNMPSLFAKIFVGPTIFFVFNKKNLTIRHFTSSNPTRIYIYVNVSHIQWDHVFTHSHSDEKCRTWEILISKSFFQLKHSNMRPLPGFPRILLFS